MTINPIHLIIPIEYTCCDGVLRRFCHFSWTDMFLLIPAFEKLETRSPWMDVLIREYDKRFPVNETNRAASAASPEMIVLNTLFSEKYCSVPLNPREIDSGKYFDSFDIDRLMKIAFELSGLAGKKDKTDRTDKTEEQNSSFDLDECVAMVGIFFGKLAPELRALSWADLIWHYEQIQEYKLKHEYPLHGIDTSKDVKKLERAKKRHRLQNDPKEQHNATTILASLPDGKLSKEEGNKLWEMLEAESKKHTKYSPEKEREMQAVANAIAMK